MEKGVISLRHRDDYFADTKQVTVDEDMTLMVKEQPVESSRKINNLKNLPYCVGKKNCYHRLS